LYLVFFDTDQIKKYVFGSPRMAEIRGASALLDYLNREKIPEIVEEICGSAGELIYTGGGSALAVVETAEQAEKLVNRIEVLYQETTVAAGITGAYLESPGELEGPKFQETIAGLVREVRKKKDKKSNINYFGLPVGLVKFCESCGVYPAEYAEENLDPEKKKLCRACQIKREFGVRMRSKNKLSRYMREFWETARARGYDWTEEYVADRQPEDLTEIGKANRGLKSHIAMIYCDGNRMGLKLREIKSRQEYAGFAQGVDKAIRTATYETLANRLPPRPLPGGDREVFPFEVLMIGGDDLIMITAADQAMEIAVEISEKFETYTRKHVGKRLTLSAGVFYANPQYPVFMMLEVAEALLKSAKSVNKSSTEEQAGVDFMVLSGKAGSDLEAEREQEFHLKTEDGVLKLTERPYTVEQIKDLIAQIKSFKRCSFPKNKLFVIYESLFRSKNQACFSTALVMTRISGDARKVLQEFFERWGATLYPWREAPAKTTGDERWYISNFPDLIELYPYALIIGGE
jgi:hypothetical protein